MHIRLIAALAVLTLAGCNSAQKPDLWLKADGRPTAGQQADLDKTACNGEASKARLAGGGYRPVGDVFGALDAEVERVKAERSIIDGCMAGKGYVRAAANG